jgi:hypothetical protein
VSLYQLILTLEHAEIEKFQKCLLDPSLPFPSFRVHFEYADTGPRVPEAAVLSHDPPWRPSEECHEITLPATDEGKPGYLRDVSARAIGK